MTLNMPQQEEIITTVKINLALHVTFGSYKYLNRRGTKRTIQNFPITAFSTDIVHCTILFRMLIPDQQFRAIPYQIITG